MKAEPEYGEPIECEKVVVTGTEVRAVRTKGVSRLLKAHPNKVTITSSEKELQEQIKKLEEKKGAPFDRIEQLKKERSLMQEEMYKAVGERDEEKRRLSNVRKFVRTWWLGEDGSLGINRLLRVVADGETPDELQKRHAEKVLEEASALLNRFDIIRRD